MHVTNCSHCTSLISYIINFTSDYDTYSDDLQLSAVCQLIISNYATTSTFSEEI